ncbi:phage/plasmid primase, P4 family [Anoxybacillus sp. CHMUD]|uniref:phage/plasmid primase, P4 family n=1 Tax=Anoxybacillus sp. CHMUD TaxID=2508870 RepID=UPI001490FAC1|nr:phage/plasmid primase, P4 family [Anoxybacillus sp. CHMUD]NNU89780.1 DNA primase [Anoxybacillus sp. CHMUD]
MIKYIELDGKVPKHSLDIFSTTHEHYHDAAVLLNNSIVVVDFDERNEAIEKLFRLFPTLRVETSRGCHLYYQKPKGVLIKNWTGKLTVAGMTIDYKTGKKSMAVIKQNGKLRRMQNEHFLNDLSALPMLPVYLYPMHLKHVLMGLVEHQGRNSALFTHLLTAKEMYELDDTFIEELAHFIDELVFGEPLGKELIHVIESVNQTYDKKKKGQAVQFLNEKDIVMTSEVLVQRLDIKYYQQKLYFKQDDHYVHNDNKLLREIDKLIKLKPNQHKQLIELFKIKSEYIEEQDFPIKLPGGYIIDDGEVIEADYGFTPYYLNVQYQEDAYDEHVDQFLDFFTMNRKDLRMVIEEMFGHILMTHSFPHVVFFFQGHKGNNGKSTFLKMINAFAGDLASQLTLNDFNDATSVAFLEGKLVNIGDDIDASYMEQSKNFKTLASGDPIMVRPIYQQPFKLKNRATLIFTCNDMPTFKDKSGGIARRVVVIPCDNHVKRRDLDLDQKLSTPNAKSYILRLALEGIQRIKANGGKLTDSLTIQAKTKEYFIASDSVLAFESENQHLILNRPAKDVYHAYVAFCFENGLREVGKVEFGRRLANVGYETKVRKINGKPIRYYQKVTDMVTDQ